eukprot:2556012-Rhodomonas_salina.4
MMRHGFLEGRAAMRISVAWILLLYISVCAQDPDIEGSDGMIPADEEELESITIAFQHGVNNSVLPLTFSSLQVLVGECKQLHPDTDLLLTFDIAESKTAIWVPADKMYADCREKEAVTSSSWLSGDCL